MLTRALESQHVTVVAVTTYDTAGSLASLDYDAFIIELESDPVKALALVQTICGKMPAATVMVYSERPQTDLLVRSMRAGAREFLSEAISPGVLAEAFKHAAARRAEILGQKKTRGKVLMFWGAKGGSGVSTVATNFAIALRRESEGEVALVDLNPQIGDIGVLLGITPRFTIEEALQNPHRLDEEFVSSLVTSHSSGISVLAASDVYTTSVPTDGQSLGKLIETLSMRFPYSVIDTGRGLGAGVDTLFQLASTIYLVTQIDVPSLRNSQRFSSYLERFSQARVELVLNRFEHRKTEFDEERLKKVIGLPPQWRVPNDYAAVRRASNTGTPLISEKSAISTVLHEMARMACGKPPQNNGKRGFKLFG
jgi:pilus assembly protein CpaE